MYNVLFIMVSVVINVVLPTNVLLVFTLSIMDVVSIDNITVVLI